MRMLPLFTEGAAGLQARYWWLSTESEGKPGAKGFWAFVLLTGGLFILTGCHDLRPGSSTFGEVVPATTRTTDMQTVNITNRLNPSLLETPKELFTLGPGDKVDLELLGETNSLVSTVVAPDGKLYYNLLPGIDVWGLTLSQAKAKMETEMAKFVRERPQIAVMLRGVESKRVWIMGRVQAPGVYSIATPTTLLEAVALAGGTLSLSSYRDQEAAGISEELADLRRSFVVREGKLLPVDFTRLLKEGDMTQNVYLQPDDFIYLPAATAREVYVLGAVTQPRAVSYRADLTVAKAIASAYGTINGAYMHHVAVVRGSLQRPQIAVIDYKRVIRGEAADIHLEPQDIVYVPFSPYRYIQKYAELILNTFVSSAAINAGTSVFGQTSGGAGVFIPLGSRVQVLPPISPPPP